MSHAANPEPRKVFITYNILEGFIEILFLKRVSDNITLKAK